MNMKQATADAIKALKSIREGSKEVTNVTLAFQEYCHAKSASDDIGEFILTEWDIVDHGIESSQYFQGCGTSFIDFDHVVTGCGDNPREAIDDCLEQIAMGSNEIPVDLDTEAKGYLDAPSACMLDRQYCEEENMDEHETAEHCSMSETHYYLSIRYNRKFSHIKTVDVFTTSIINGNCARVIERLQNMPIDRALAVTAYIVEYLRKGDTSYRGRFLADLGRLTD